MYHLKDRSSEYLLLFTEGAKWYLGRLSEWSTYAAEKNLAGKEAIWKLLTEEASFLQEERNDLADPDD